MTRNEKPDVDSSLYDVDFFVWTQRQAEALRALPRETASQGVDIEHIAEEIEDLGKRDLREVESYLGRLVEHLVTIDACRRTRTIQHWRHEARLFAHDARKSYTSSMRRLIDVDAIWRDGLNLAQGALEDSGVTYDEPTACPVTLDDLMAEPFDVDAALAKLVAARDTSHA